MVKTILHLSDLHFSYEGITKSSFRTNALDSLLAAVQAMKDRPDIVVISGDITWRGQKSGYEEAAVWIKRVLDACGLGTDRLIVCPGNHDVSLQHTGALFPPPSADKADAALYAESLDPLKEPFADYCEFYKSLGVPQMAFSGDLQDSTLVGVRTVEGITFVVLNSAWFYRGNQTQDQMWLGLPHVEIMKKKVPSFTDYDGSNITVGVFHHPNSALANSEVNEYQGRKATFRYLAQNTHLLLQGHAHSEDEYFPDRIAGGAYSIVTGAAYEDGSYRNRCSVIYLDEAQRLFALDNIAYNPYKGTWEIRRVHEWKTLHREEPVQARAFPAVEKRSIRAEMANAGMEWNKFNEDLLRVGGCIVWPVVPRPNLTVIHRAQAEIISLLCSFGCEVKILIADSGADHVDRNGRFFAKLERHMKLKGIDHISVRYLSDYYSIREHSQDRNTSFLQCFCELCNEITLASLISANEKNYPEKTKAEIRGKSLLRNIRPVLTVAAVLCEAVHLDKKKKHVVIAGQDEEFLWNLIFEKFGDENMGTVLNPVLTLNEGNAYQDNELDTEWHTKAKVLEMLKIKTVREWAYTMFYYLPHIEATDYADVFLPSYTGPRCGLYRELADWVDDQKLAEYLYDKFMNVL